MSKILKLSILADTDNLTKNLRKAEGDTETFGSKMGDIGKKVGLAFAAAAAAAGAYAIKIGVEGVRAAMEDEQAQTKLAQTLKNVTGATDAQIKATEEWITKTQLLYGISDSDLRPALDRLVRATKDVGEAQKLTSLAMDISAGTGKSLEAVSNALGKAYEGNTAALGRLGLGIDKAQLKTMSFDEVTQLLSKTFEGQASKQADTFAGKIARLSEAWAEAKETVGTFIVEALTPLLNFTVDKLLPMLGTFSTAIGERISGPVQATAGFVTGTLLPAWQNFYNFIMNSLVPSLEKALRPALDRITESAERVRKQFSDNDEQTSTWSKTLASLGKLLTEIVIPAFGWLIDKSLIPLLNRLEMVIKAFDLLFTGLSVGIKKAVDFAINAINVLIEAYNRIPWLKDVNSLSPVNWNGSGGANFGRASGSGSSATSSLTSTVSATTATLAQMTETMNTLSKSGSGGSGGSNDAAVAQTVDAIQSMINQLQVMYAETEIAKLNYLYDLAKQQGTVINVNGYVLDPEGTARAIEDVLYQSEVRSGYGAIL